MNIKFFLRIFQKCRQLYWRLFQPLTIGARALVVNRYGKILLIKHTYQSGWYLPGGRIRRKESLWDGLKRELQQEAGVVVINAGRILGVYSNFSEYKSDHIVVFVIADWTMMERSHFEIAEKCFFDPYDLPADCSPATKRRIAEYTNDTLTDPKW